MLGLFQSSIQKFLRCISLFDLRFDVFKLKPYCLQLIKFSGVKKAEACTIVLRGATKQILDEAERSLHDALCVLSQTTAEPRIVFGGGMLHAHLPLADELPVTQCCMLRNRLRGNGHVQRRRQAGGSNPGQGFGRD